jgi:hypothetical protein
LAESQQPKMASAALRHPIRVRALEVMNVRREVSATMFVNEGFSDDLETLKGRSPRQRIADVAYHLRALEKAGCCYLSREVKRRGGIEKLYRANAVAYFSDEEWAELKRYERREITRVVAQSLIVQMEGAMLADTFDSRVDRWLVWEPLQLDDVGWRQLNGAIAALHAGVGEIKREAKERIAEGVAAETINTTFGVVSFESPEHSSPALPDD